MHRNRGRGSGLRNGSFNHPGRGNAGPGLLGNMPRHGHQGAPSLLGGPPGMPFDQGPRRDALHRGSSMNPWESGVVPGGGLGMSQMRTGGGGGALFPSQQLSQGSLLGNPQGMNPLHGGLSGAPGLLGNGPPNTLIGINAREPKMGMGLMGPMGGGRNMRYGGPPPNKMRRLDNRMMSSRNSRDVDGHYHRHHDRQRQDSNKSSRGSGGSLASGDLRRRLKDKRVSDADSSSSNRKSYTGSSSDADRATATKAASDTKQSSDTDTSPQGSRYKADEDLDDTTFPVEAVHCHICQLYKFTSKKAYLGHLKGSLHEEMARAFHNNNSAILQLLRAQSKMAAQRQLIASKVEGERVKTSQCFKCHCQVPGSLQKHIASVEHKLVNNFQILKCCDVWYSNRLDYEEHRLSLTHQQREYERKEKRKQEQQEQPAEEQMLQDDQQESCDLSWASAAAVAVKELQKTTDRKPLTTNSVTPYSGEQPIGAEYLCCRGVVQCQACEETVEPQHLITHCRSSLHYYSILKDLKQKEEKEKSSAAQNCANGEQKEQEEVKSEVDEVKNEAEEHHEKELPPANIAAEREVEEEFHDEAEDDEGLDYDVDVLEEADMPQLEFEDQPVAEDFIAHHQTEDDEAVEASPHYVDEDKHVPKEASPEAVMSQTAATADFIQNAVTDDTTAANGHSCSSEMNKEEMYGDVIEKEATLCANETDAVNNANTTAIVNDTSEEVADEKSAEQLQNEEQPDKVEEESEGLSSPSRNRAAAPEVSTPSRRSARAARKRKFSDEEEELELHEQQDVMQKISSRGRGRGRGRSGKR